MAVSLFACGDIFIENERSQIVTPQMSRIIQNADISMCNLEGPVQNDGKPIKKVGANLYQVKNAAEIVRDAGFDVCVLANNHIYDYGIIGLNKTLEALDDVSLKYVGAGVSSSQAYASRVFEVKDLSISCLAYADSEFGCLVNSDADASGYAWIDNVNVNLDISNAKKHADFVLVNVHAGVEDVPLPLPEWKSRYRELCDAGADIVIGHHPHVPQGYEYYNGSLIFYSLGNFFFDYGKYGRRSNRSYSVLFDLKKDEPPGFELIFHQIKNGLVSNEEDVELFEYLKQINSYDEAMYRQLSDVQVLKLYEERYKRLNQIDLKSLVIYAAKHTLTFGKFLYKRKLLIQHNMGIASHRYAALRAILCDTNKIDNKSWKGFSDLFERFKKITG